PELRRAYLSVPWPHLYEHPSNNACIAIERRFGDEDAVFFGHIRSPEEQTLSDLDLWMRQRKEWPIERIGSFRRALMITRWPLPIRRLIWWCGLNTNGRRRARRLCTFGVSAYAGLGAASLHPLAPLTITMNYG